MPETRQGNPIPAALVVLLLVAGGWYFFRTYSIQGLDQISVHPKDAAETASQLASYAETAGPVTSTTGYQPLSPATPDTQPRNLKIASWALDGLGPTKLSRDEVCQTLVRVLRQFDVIAIQQVAAVERDVVPRLVEKLNAFKAASDAADDQTQPLGSNDHVSERVYDYIEGQPTGPADRPEQFAFLFDTRHIFIDRSQTYELADPDNKLTYDPLVAWFRAAQPPPRRAWTFTMVNVRVDLAEAAKEAKLVPSILESVQTDGRGEDDVLVAGLFQADAGYLLPTIGRDSVAVSVKSVPTDVFGHHQTSNLLFDRSQTTEFIGRSGVLDFLRRYNLDLDEAEAVTPHLPVHAEFTATEVGEF